MTSPRIAVESSGERPVEVGSSDNDGNAFVGGAGLTNPDDPVPISDHPLAPLKLSARLWLTVGPVGGFALILLVTALVESPGAAGFLISIALGTFIGGGKLMILAGAVEGAPLGPWALAALVVYVDLATALVALGGMHYLFRLPVIGRNLRSAQEAGWKVLEGNPWMYRATWLGVAGLIAVPFQATGAVAGVVVGRLVGLKRVSIVAATCLGSVLGSMLLAVAGDYWEERITAIAGRPLLAAALVIGMFALMIASSHLLHSRTRKAGS